MEENRQAVLYGICEGQGIANTVCLKELRELHAQYGELLEELFKAASATLGALANLPETSDFFHEIDFDVRQWIEDPQAAPEDDILPLAPLSLPLVGLLSLGHFCVTCKILDQTPAEVNHVFTGVTGHSQGVITAAAIAQSTDWPSFYDGARMAMTMLFWIGLECHKCMPFNSVLSETVKDSLDAGEGTPSPILSIRGLERGFVEQLLEKTNRHLSDHEKMYVALINARDNFVIAGSPDALFSLNIRLRNMRATDGLDQSKIVFNQRKPIIQHQFLPMSSAFHCPHSDKATPSILERLQSVSLRGEDFRIGVYHTRTGEDLRKHRNNDVIACLVRMVTADLVDWPSVMQACSDPTFVDFGPGRIGSLLKKSTEGAGLMVLRAFDLIPSSGRLGSKPISVSTSHLPKPLNWEKSFKPRIKMTSSGIATVETKMTRLFGVPPVMVSGMTPTTVHWDVVSSIMEAGYHAELALGGYNTASSLESAIVKLSQNIPSTRGITCNIIYANPRAIGWQVPLIQDLVRRGYPIEGLTIGAGVPSDDVVKEYIETMGLKHICFKPGSTDAINRIIGIAKAYPDFPIGLQWTGGRAGGHHSFEDFHIPILETYGQIRQYDNIVLIAGSGFGGADDTYPYLSGKWSKDRGYPAMPFDGVLLGSRMMVAKEAHTSFQAKVLIVRAAGVKDSQWHTTYTEPTGGIITVRSEMGQPIHKLATRGVLLWNELDKKIFSIADRSRRLQELQRNRSWIIERLNTDFQKPWFSIDKTGKSVELEDITYFECLRRLMQLMYLPDQDRWVDPSYQSFVSAFADRICERLRCATPLPVASLNSPNEFLETLLRAYPDAEVEFLHPEDVSFFMGLCSQRGRKPVNFVPRLDDNFETSFKKDSLWQAEDTESVPDQDAQRTCIIQGPVAVRYSTVVNEPVKTILDGITASHLNRFRQEPPSQVNDAPSDIREQLDRLREPLQQLIVEDTPTRKTYQFPTAGELPDAELFRKSILEDLFKESSRWARVCISEKDIRQRNLSRPNPIRSAIIPIHGHSLSIIYKPGKQAVALIMSITESPSARYKEVLRVSKDCDDDSVVISLLGQASRSSEDARLEFRFKSVSEMSSNRLCEDMHGRSRKIKNFYAKLWLGSNFTTLQEKNLHQRFLGMRLTLSSELVQSYSKFLSSQILKKNPRMSSGVVVPLHTCVAIAWEALVKPLLSKVVDCDLVRLLHRSNQFRYIDGAKPLKVGDAVESSSRIQSITIQKGNKLVEVIAEIKREGVTVVEIISKFLCKGSFTDFENTVSRIKEPDFEVVVKSERECALLASRKWVEIFCDPKELIGKTVRFDVTSYSTCPKNGHFDGLRVGGEIYTLWHGKTRLIGRVKYECGPCHGNPILDFLNRHGSQLHNALQLQHPGVIGESSWTVKAPQDNRAYSLVSKDTNPIHVSPVFAHYAQLPGIVNHGMSTSALVFGVLEKNIAQGDTARIRRYSASFEGMVLPGNQIRIHVQHIAMVEGRLVLHLEAVNDLSNEKVIEAEAEVEQPATAYLFTGQGSQEKAMGMALYESSKVARDIWDSADKYLHKTYGFSIIDIVRNDPKTLSIYFGGSKGRRIRDNYLSMTIERKQADGRVTKEPIVKSLTPTSKSYTFSDPRGLLYSTQFAQPALVLMEMAAFADLESRGMIQKGATYAGHSLGEYSALGTLARAIPMESLVSLTFYRGLTMQVAIERDKDGRTAFSMMAVNPSRINRAFNQDRLSDIVKMISKKTSTLLEIVNFNVQERQYVCAGHLRALWTMTQVLNTLAQTKDIDLHDEPALSKLIHDCAEEAFELAEPIELEQGTATTPLRGIDVPFHSTYLRNGIPAYRNYLQTKILEENLDLDRLSSFIPNVTAKPFSTDKAYVEEVAEITGSESLRELLDNVSIWLHYG